jgi:hypothetical protein
MAELDWDGLHCQSHIIALNYAKMGYNVFYINRTLQRFPNINHLVRRLKKSTKLGTVNTYKDKPENINVITLWLGPPFKWMRKINQILIKFGLRKIDNKVSLFLTYVPSFNSIDLSNYLKPKKTAYVCYHNFDADTVIKDLLLAEKEVINKADYLFADSLFLKERILKLSNRKKVYRSMPGVYFDLFHKAYRGDEAIKKFTLYYFGCIKNDLDFDLYKQLANYVKIIFVGVIDPSVKNLIPINIELRPPVSNKELPKTLFDADIIGLFYRDCPFVRGIIPAKLFECISTCKPILISGLEEAKPYEDIIYNINGDYKKAISIINNLANSETPEIITKRKEIGMQADWDNRFKEFHKVIEGA